MCVLYRCYRRDGALLYAGGTADLGRRLREHASTTPWWADVQTIRLEHFSDAHSLLLARRAAIRQERPRYNHAASGGGHRADPEIRQRILDCIARCPTPVSPRDIASALGRNPSTIRVLLRKMVSDGQVDSPGPGQYSLRPVYSEFTPGTARKLP